MAQKNKIPSIEAPFLGSPMKFIAGQDPLGLLNLGERTFDLLLPCLSNVTHRLRNYAFYAWFMEIYARDFGFDTKEEQRRFLRRAEFLLALIYARNNWTGVAGINKAKDTYHADSPSFDLRAGTGERRQNDSGYWKNPGGIFGQNYVSPMMQAGFIQRRNPEEMVYMRTEYSSPGLISGHQLAHAFRDNIGTAMEKKFIHLVSDGVVEQRDLHRLSNAFNVNVIPPQTREHELLWNFIAGPDFPRDNDPTWFRRNTIKLIFRHIETEGPIRNALEFTYKSYAEKGSAADELEETYTLWFYFQLEQFWHMVCTGCLSSFLIYLHSTAHGGWYDENKLLDDLAKKVNQYLVDSGLVIGQPKLENIVITDSDELKIADLTRANNPVESIANALVLLRKILHENSSHLERLRAVSHRFNGLSTPSSFIQASKDVLLHKEDTLTGFIIYFLNRYVVLRHQWVAISKMYETLSTEKFIREDGKIRFIDRIYYGYSGPRIMTIVGFLTDLGLISAEDGTITPLGASYQASLQP